MSPKVVSLLLAACLVAAPAAARKPVVVTLGPNEIPVMTYGVWWTSRAATLCPEGIEKRVETAELVDNGVLIRSMAPLYRLVFYTAPLPPGVVTPANERDTDAIAAAALGDPRITKVVKDVGLDDRVVWTDLSGGSGGGGVSVVPVQWAILEGKWSSSHELGHEDLCGHNSEAPGGCGGGRSWACDFIAEDGTCGVHGYSCTRVPVLSGPNVVYRGVTYGDKNHDNVRMVTETAISVANRQVLLADPDRSCAEDVETTCLGSRFRVRMQFADTNSPNTGWATSTSDGVTGTFTFPVGTGVVKVTASPNRTRPRKTDLTISGSRSSMPYAVVVTDTLNGMVRAWLFPRGKVVTLALPQVF